MESTKITVADFLAYLQQRDLNSLMNLFSIDIKWNVPGNEQEIAWLGSRESKQEIEEFFKLLWRSTQPVSAEIHRILIEGSQVMIKGEFCTKMLKTNKIVSSVFFIHMVVRYAKIIEYTLLEDSFAVSQSLRETVD